MQQNVTIADSGARISK